MRRISLALTAFALIVSLAPHATSQDELPPYNGAKQAHTKAMKSKDPTEKARAFEYLRARPELDALESLVISFKKASDESAAVRKTQAVEEKKYEGLINKLDKVRKKFEESPRGPRDISSFNKSERKLSKEIDAARRKAKQLENDWAKSRALLDAATDVAASILDAMEEQPVEDGLAVLRMSWLDGTNPEGPMRWMEALTPVRRAAVTKELHAALADPGLAQEVRVAALTALGERQDGMAMGKAIDMLGLPPAQFPMVTAAIGVLQHMHDKRGIVPLIEFLKREDLARLRGDAREALVSLTGQTHGPYFEPWWAWWDENEKSFTMPPEPCPSPTVVAQDEGMTFYGIHTFSDRVLFIVDISASMDWALKGTKGEPGGEKAKWVTARKELIGAVNNLDEGANFNVILFNHEVLSWNARGVVTANASTKKKLERWVEDVTVSGLTNIHDALEGGFRLILRTTGRPDFDTIFFLTDGKPTAGKVLDSKRILDAVREWNAISNTQIHVIGIGGDEDIDEEFLQELAKIGKGKYVRRGG